MHRLSRERRLVLAVAVSFGLTVLCFVTSRIVTEMASRRIEKEAESISQNALIAAEALAGARTNLRKGLSAMSALRVSDAASVGTERLGSQLEDSRRDAAANWAKYRSIPFYPGERELVERVEPEVVSATLAVGDVGARLRHGDREGALSMFAGRALPRVQRAEEGLGRLIRFNGREAQHAAARILASMRPWGLLPELMAACFALASAYFGVRLLRQYLTWAAERSAELEEFAARVAHDIRSPLGSVSLAIEMAQRGKDVDSKTRDLLGRVSRTMERIANLVDGLLVFATSGGYLVPGMLSEPKTSTGDVLSGVAEDLKLEAAAKNIEIDYEAPASALSVACSPGVFISMTSNLVANAMKFMGDALLRRITIRARQLGHDVEVAVSDTGPGIPPELRQKVFQPYVRAESNVPGYGLGLATVRKLAEAHKGTVGVEESPSGGCRFWFRLPVAS
jgi:signal transduction histidine kinase